MMINKIIDIAFSGFWQFIGVLILTVVYLTFCTAMIESISKIRLFSFGKNKSIEKIVPLKEIKEVKENVKSPIDTETVSNIYGVLMEAWEKYKSKNNGKNI